MQKELRYGFTMLEVLFVIVVIGILAAIALPRFSDTADMAYESKGQSVLAAVRSALATERQKRILRGDTTAITDLGQDNAGNPSAGNAFDRFSADQNGNHSRVVDYPIPACSGAQRGCWKRTNATRYSFLFPKAADGQADFILQNNRLDCNADANDCKKIE